jgi:hypothetical protein
MLIRVLAAAIAGAVIFFFGGWVLYGVLLRSYFDGTLSEAGRSIMSPEPRMVPLIIAEIAFGFLFAFIFDQWANIRSFGRGILGGAFIGFLISLIFDLQMMSFMPKLHSDTSIGPIILDLACAAVIGGVGGGVIGAVLGMMNKTEAPATT